MSKLSDKLKSLGVQVGSQGISQPLNSRSGSIENALSGEIINTPLGETLLIEEHIPVGHKHGRYEININAPLGRLAKWVADERIAGFSAGDFAFIDTETTGLSGGTGTYAFLIGIGRFDGNIFRMAQFFMRDPIEEPAQLHAIEEFLAPCSGLVTYNGKSFDIPLINSRFTAHGLKTPLNAYAHVDLLHLARRLWTDRLPSRTLGNIEVNILAHSRTEDDVPGWMIPQMYFDYLRSGDPKPLKRVLYHNAIDVISLAVLLNHCAAILDNPLHPEIEHPADIIALAKLFENMNDYPMAVKLYLHGLNHEQVKKQNIPKKIIIQALERLGLIYKRSGNFDAAVELWKEAAKHKHIESHIELAKYYEHKLKQYKPAIHWTEQAINLGLQLKDLPEYNRKILLSSLEHRQLRLLSKHKKQTTD